MGKLTNKVAVVTGASKGIGASIARHLAAEGASTVVNYATDEKGANLLVAEITKAGGKAIAVQASVAVESEVVSLFEQTAKAYGKVDILVKAAGVYAFAPIESVTAAEFGRQFNEDRSSAVSRDWRKHCQPQFDCQHHGSSHREYLRRDQRRGRLDHQDFGQRMRASED